MTLFSQGFPVELVTSVYGAPPVPVLHAMGLREGTRHSLPRVYLLVKETGKSHGNK